ncbi:MAG: hypothetical protein HWQ44_19430 [Nostoc sp. JL34]|uniref:hypothetical protein n=1 Tax=Nostoc sp. JL34 TaxID=2815397 RepID=UPI001DD6D3BC|nr:hypothetical protein [Nostoc sp. JL34]MBN3885052.1 hypothetical protein [Nostoc sp. JL34]
MDFRLKSNVQSQIQSYESIEVKIGGLLMITLAMPAAGYAYAYANRCFCPPETFAPTAPAYHIFAEIG